MITFTDEHNAKVSVTTVYREYPVLSEQLVTAIHGKHFADVFLDFVIGAQTPDSLGFASDDCGLVSRWPVDRTIEGFFFPLAEMDPETGFQYFREKKHKMLQPIQERFQRLLEFLENGICVGYGRDASMSLIEIPRAFWTRPGIEIDLLRGDLIETGPLSTGVMFRAIELECRIGTKEGPEQKRETLYAIVDREVEKLDDSKGYFDRRGARAEFARRIHEQHRHYTEASVIRVLRQVLNSRLSLK